LNRQSTRPKDFTQAWITRTWTNCARSRPSAFSSCVPSGARRPQNTAFAPSSTKRSTVRRPMPLVAPVMMDGAALYSCGSAPPVFSLPSPVLSRMRADLPERARR
jgi:hypothetical protein